jgi:hypothetical protein
MENRASTIVSYIFHPLFMPVLGAFIIMWNDPLLYVSLNDPLPWIIMLGTVAICTILLPLFFCWTLLKMGRISSLQTPTGEDRRVLMMFTELGFLLAYLTFHRIPTMGHSISLFMLGINIAMVVTLIINFIQKTSFHTTGMGGLLGTTIGLMYYAKVDLKYWIIALILLCYFGGYARYKLKAHDTFELYLGYMVGIVSLFAVFYFGTSQP